MPLLNAKELSKFLNVHPEQIARLRLKEGLPTLRVGIRSYRYDLDKVVAWLEARQQNSSEVKARG